MPDKPEKIGAKAAETTTAVNGLVGFRRSEIIKSFGLMAGYAAKQPKPFAKHIAKYAAEMIEVAKGTSELEPERKDRRFRDESWQKNPLYKRGMQSWLAMKNELNGWIDDSRMHPADQARARFATGLLVDALAPTNTLLGTLKERAVFSILSTLEDLEKLSFDEGEKVALAGRLSQHFTFWLQYHDLRFGTVPEKRLIDQGVFMTLIQITPYWRHGEGYAELLSEFANDKIG